MAASSSWFPITPSLRANDNNGAGLTAKVSLDISSLGSFTTATQIMIDGSTGPLNGPTAASISAQSPISLSFTGYGVAFLKLQ